MSRRQDINFCLTSMAEKSLCLNSLLLCYHVLYHVCLCAHLAWRRALGHEQALHTGRNELQ